MDSWYTRIGRWYGEVPANLSHDKDKVF